MLGKKIKDLLLPLKSSLKTQKDLSSPNYPMPMRDFIHDKLYLNSQSYYNTKSSIGRLEDILNFSEMKGIADYVSQLNKHYPKSTYLTCSELLKPYFGYAIGNYIMNKQKNAKGGIKIVEFGSGMGKSLQI